MEIPTLLEILYETKQTGFGMLNRGSYNNHLPYRRITRSISNAPEGDLNRSLRKRSKLDQWLQKVPDASLSTTVMLKTTSN